MCYYFTYCLINNDNEQYFRFVYLPLPNYLSPLTFIGTYLYTPIYLSTYRPIYLYISLFICPFISQCSRRRPGSRYRSCYYFTILAILPLELFLHDKNSYCCHHYDTIYQFFQTRNVPSVRSAQIFPSSGRFSPQLPLRLLDGGPVDIGPSQRVVQQRRQHDEVHADGWKQRQLQGRVP